MTEEDRIKISIIKSKIEEILIERQQFQNGHHNIFIPSNYWADFCSYFDYMPGLSEEAFAKLRLHTYHLTGDNYQTYTFQDPYEYRIHADVLTKDIPPEFILNEPEGGIGFLYEDGRFLSRDILRFQRVINALYRHGVFNSLLDPAKQKRNYVIEIGAGYGGLVHHLSNIVGKATFIIVDLPEVLLFSAAYLSLLNPQKKIYIYNSQDFAELINSSAIETFDFILVPNYRLDSLRHLQFELALNVSSLQEMTVEQVETYLDFIQATTTGVFYSLNQDKQPANNQLSNLSEMLRNKFELIEIKSLLLAHNQVKQMSGKKYKLRKALKSVASFVGLLEQPAFSPAPYPYREYICRPLLK